MNKVISMSVFGTKKLYLLGALRNIQIAQKLFPDWQIWFYVSDDVPRSYRVKFEKANVRLIEMGMSADRAGAFWRFYAADEADICIFRDADSRLLERDVIAVDEWLATDKLIHIIRDNPAHTRSGKFPIQAGMWGCRKGLELGAKMKQWPSFDNYGQDEHFLREMIWPLASEQGFVHDDFTNAYREVSKNVIKQDRKNYGYIGENYIFDKKDREWPRRPHVRQNLAQFIYQRDKIAAMDPLVWQRLGSNQLSLFNWQQYYNPNTRELCPKKVLAIK